MKKGFTLTELLAVIIIIGLLLFIAMPMVNKIIYTSREGAFIDSGYGTLKAADNFYVLNSTKLDFPNKIELPSNLLDLRGKKIDDGSIQYDNSGNTKAVFYNSNLKLCIFKNYKNNKFTVRRDVTSKDDCKSDDLIVDSDSGSIIGGFITLELYYPEKATNKMWMLMPNGTVRLDKYEFLQDYIGPITIPVDRVEDLVISYTLDGEDIMKYPDGDIWVYINTSSNVIPTGGKVDAKIRYDKTIDTVEYKIGNSDYKEYKDEIINITKPCIIYAKVTKMIDIYDDNGNKLGKKMVTKYDSVIIRDKLIADKNPSTITPGEVTDGSIINPDTGKVEGNIGEDLEAPIIDIEPNTKTTSVTVSLTTKYKSRGTYIKVGNNNYERYSSPIVVDKNTTIRTYYIKEDTGSISYKSFRSIDNIIEESIDSSGNKGTKPYITIKADPYPYPGSKLVDKVKVSIESEDADSVYIATTKNKYERYTKEIEIDKNSTIYAKASNSYGDTYKELNITNIGTNDYELPIEMVKLDLDITINPSINNIDSTTVTINADTRATEVYYRLSRDTKLTSYTNPFVLSKNDTVYAYCYSTNGYGENKLAITNLNSGIGEPIIEGSPNNSKQASKVEINIKYDDKAAIKKYKINNSDYVDYSNSFSVEENSTIQAYQENKKGDIGKSTYYITNINNTNNSTVEDLGNYILVKLNYPSISNKNTWEYKYKDNDWKSYKSDGIMFSKITPIPNTPFKYTDKEGNIKTFNGDIYFYNGSNFNETIKMRWDPYKPSSPNIILSTESPTKNLDVILSPDKNSSSSDIKFNYEDGTSSGFNKYKDKVNIDKNNTLVEARSITSNEVYSDISTKAITNIDNKPPTIIVKSDNPNPTRKLELFVEAIDDNSISTFRYDKGIFGISYFKDNGINIDSNYIVITDNGDYTFYARDIVGNESIYNINITNIDPNAPDFIIDVTPKDITTSIDVDITYNNYKSNMYKVGSENYKGYSGPFKLDSNYIIDNKLYNSDHSITICAKGENASGSSDELCKTIYNLDTNRPDEPIITGNSGYPVITEYGIGTDTKVSIKFDTSKDIINEYSLDNIDWKSYKGPFDTTSSKVYARSTKKISRLSITKEFTLNKPTDALDTKVYDGSIDTGSYMTKSTNGKVYVDKSALGKELVIYCKSNDIYGGSVIRRVYDDGNNLIKEDTLAYKDTARKAYTYTIPSNASYIIFTGPNTTSYNGYLYEVMVNTIPKVINEISYAPKLSAYGYNGSYTTFKLNYYANSINKLYNINSSNYKEYKGETIRLNANDTLQAKSVNDKNIDSMILTKQYITPNTYMPNNIMDDNKTTTSYINSTNNYRLDFDDDIKGSNIIIKGKSDSIYGGGLNVTFYKGSTAVSTNTYFQANISYKEMSVNIPTNCDYMIIKGTASSYRVIIYDIVVDSVPKTSSYVNHAPTITSTGMVDAHESFRLSYFKTSIKRLYRTSTDGVWLNYNDEVFNLYNGDYLEAKGIDSNGIESNIYTNTYSVPTNYLPKNGYSDENTSAYIARTNSRMDINKEMMGKNMTIIYQNTSHYGGSPSFTFYDSKDNKVGLVELPAGNSNKNTGELLIPSNASYAVVDSTSSYNRDWNVKLFVIKP